MEETILRVMMLHWLVPHQANKRIIDATAQRMGVREDKVMINIQKYGNTTSATLPLCLWDYENNLKKEITYFSCFWRRIYLGVIYLKWAYNS